MIKIKESQNDDSSFISIVNTSLNNIITNVKPKDIYIVCIDHSFDHKWLAYSGKFEGILPVWNKRLTVPAFNPNRIVKITYLKKQYDKSSYLNINPKKFLHLFYPSMGNIRYYIDELTNSGVFCWYSGDTANNTSGSLMIYIVTDDSTDYWYASFILDNEWRCNKTKSIGRDQFEKIVGLR